MPRASFFENKGPFCAAHLARITDSRPLSDPSREPTITDVAPIDDAGPTEISFLGDTRMKSLLATTGAGVCFVSEALLDLVSRATVALVTKTPELAFARVIAEFYPDAALNTSWASDFSGFSGPAHPRARLEEGVTICPGAIICEGAEVGAGTVIGPNAVIGPNVKIGRNCSIGPNSTLVHSLVGNRVIVHAGAAIGQDGFGYTGGPRGLVKIPQIGRVVIQDDVEIGSNAAIDRGALSDTVIGEGTKLDNFVQVGHNVSIGRFSAIAAQTGISGSVVIGDAVMIGGQTGIAPHMTVGNGAHLAAGTGVIGNVEPGERVVGRPHRSIRQFARELRAVGKLAQTAHGHRPR